MKIFILFVFFLGKNTLGPNSTGVLALPPPTAEENEQEAYWNQQFGIETDVSNSDWIEDDASEPEVDEHGNYLIADMVLSEQQYHLFYGDENNVLEDSGLTDRRARWPNGEVPYTFDGSVGSRDRKIIENAIDRFNSELSGCINIRPRKSGENDYVKIINGRGCYSSVGKRHSGQDLSIKSGGCTSAGTIAHEFIHALGFHHEQNRPDRDKYVTINWENVPKSKRHNFQTQRHSSTFGVPYDGKSIMHYRSKAFGNGKTTIEAKSGNSFKTRELGTSRWMQKSDVQKLRKMYKCTDGPSPSEEKCRTNNNVKCVFPFKYNGKTYNQCTSVESDVPWCATQVGRDGTVITGQWGDCGQACKKASGCKTIDRVDCVFPFKYNGRTYNQCTSIESSVPWCATGVGRDNNVIKGEWGDCDCD